MATKETCSQYEDCGFAHRTGNPGSDCGIEIVSTCPRIRNLDKIDIGEKLIFESEIKAANPILYKDEKGKPRRILKGTHR